MANPQCTECDLRALPTLDRCYSHLSSDERREALASSDPVLRGQVTASFRYHEGRRPTPDDIGAARPAVSKPAIPPSSQRSTLICPHCHERGRVTSRSAKVKRGVSGSKLTGAVLTAGISMLGTGLSRKQTVTERHCGACGSNWTVS